MLTPSLPEMPTHVSLSPSPSLPLPSPRCRTRPWQLVEKRDGVLLNVCNYIITLQVMMWNCCCGKRRCWQWNLGLHISVILPELAGWPANEAKVKDGIPFWYKSKFWYLNETRQKFGNLQKKINSLLTWYWILFWGNKGID